MTAPYYADDRVTVHHGRVEDVLPTLPDASVDAVVTDPPYNLPGGFMGREWDRFEHGSAFQAWCEVWAAECLRILKPGGYLLAFGGTRTWHRMVCGIEDAGFEIRDSTAVLTGQDAPGLIWTYGSGFPKSLDVSKAIDKASVAAPLWDEIRAHLRHWRDERGLNNTQLNAAVGGATNGGGRASAWLSEDQRKPELPSKAQWSRLREVLRWDRTQLDDIYDAVKDGADRPLLAERTTVRIGGDWAEQESAGMFRKGEVTFAVTASATDGAARWEGWGTALKPAWEPIAVARKPLVGTVAGNVTAYGTGALNIDGCRTGNPEDKRAAGTKTYAPHRLAGGTNGVGVLQPAPHDGLGRWPTNLVLAHSADCGEACAADCPVAELDRQSGVRPSGGAPDGSHLNIGLRGNTFTRERSPREADSGGASRYFPVFRYEAKAPASERPKVDGVAHPTVKPLDLLRWLARLVTPPGGLVLDPFLGSGTTAEACVIEGFRCVGIEREAEYLPLIKARLDKPLQTALGFDLEAS